MIMLPKMSFLSKSCMVLLCLISIVRADNQTPDVTPLSSQASLPFSIQIEKIPVELPVGIHSGTFGEYKGLLIFVAGSNMGLHGFGPDPFPPEKQNTTISVVDPIQGTVYSRSLYDVSSGLNQHQIDSLSVISPQYYQSNNTLYISGGYGFDTETGTFGTKPLLTALYLPGVVHWVTQGANSPQTLAQTIRQLENPLFQITGGRMSLLNGVTQLVFGQNFAGVYTPSSDGNYSNQIRRFKIRATEQELAVDIYNSIPAIPDPNFRRRDLNILPTVMAKNGRLQYGLIAFGGVFTLSGGVWTVPVVINENGQPIMADPNSAFTFKQGMNQYVSASASLYSRKYQSSYHVLLGGISYGFFLNGVFQTDTEIPFINQVTTIQMDKNGHFNQYIMDNEYPVILSTQANPGNPLLFGASAYFIPKNITHYANGVISLDSIRQPTVIGYIVGGIQSTVPNTSTDDDSSASRYIFKVILTPK